MPDMSKMLWASESQSSSTPDFTVAFISHTQNIEGTKGFKQPVPTSTCEVRHSEPPRLFLPRKQLKLRPWSDFSLHRNLDHCLRASFPWYIRSLGWSAFWSEVCSDHGPSFVQRSQKRWGMGRRMSIETCMPNCFGVPGE